MSSKQKMPQRFDSLNQWRKIYIEAEMVFRLMGDENSLSLLQQINSKIQEIKANNLLAERLDYEDLEQLTKNHNFPYSIISWYEDEKKDIWDNLTAS